ncbi:MAG: nuclear transport factor 2 family protein [Phycisphaerae bacterium]
MDNAPISESQARAFADSWYAAWNAHNLQAILAHYAPTIEHSSPFVSRYRASDDLWIRGIAALRDYFAHALERNPDLRFDPLHVAVGATSLVLVYRRMSGHIAAEVFYLNAEGKVVRSVSHYDRA